MEKNTVLLSVEDYNELRDFKKEITDGKVLVSSSNGGFGGNSIYYYTDDEIAKELSKRNGLLNSKISELERQIGKLKATNKDEPKAMNYWQFRKWKSGKL